ncbi:MAG: methyltransferase domain-containing protein [Deltaproteobacteria bacterium]|nr:methyltransferase domain-containing protein [Deltaproteobacteria bacterium]
MTIQQAFDAHATEYDGLRRKFIPCFDDFYGVALSLLPLAAPAGLGEAFPILDLGAGTGLLAALALAAFPAAQLTLLDLSEGMLAQARERFRGQENRVSLVAGDYLRTEGLGPFRAVISSLSIHHLEHEDKPLIFRKIGSWLAPGGLFINADQAAGASPAVQEFYQALWWSQVRAAGLTETQQAEARQRLAYDRLAPLADQLAWLRQAGFQEVECHYKHYGFVVYAGRQPAED